MLFEFDESKNQINIQKHKVSFEEVQDIWNDPNLVLLSAKKRGEKRKMAIGQIYTVCYSVIHTKRDEVIRIISARRSTEKEEKLYEKNRRY